MSIARAFQQLVPGIDVGGNRPQTESRPGQAGPLGSKDVLVVLGSRETVLNELLVHASAIDGNGYVCLTGAPGSGKSALLAHLSKHAMLNHQPATLLIRHFVGASPGSTDVRRTLRRLCHELKTSCLDITTDIPDDPEKLRVAFPDFLRQACARRRVVILLDAVNQFDPASHSAGLHWLPTELPDNARVILSALDGPALEELRRRPLKAREIELEPLTAADCEAIIEQFRKRYRKKFEPDQRASLLAKTDAGTPLYLLAALDELRTLGIYEEITRRIAELPPTAHELFVWILKRLENDDGFRDAAGRRVGRGLVCRFAALLGASRYGLSHRELGDLLDAGDPQGNVAALLHLLRPYLMRRGELLDFSHSQFRAAALDAWLKTELQRQTSHQYLGKYFHDKLNPPDDEPWSGNYVRALSELPYHRTQAKDWAGLEATLCDLRFIQAKCKRRLTFDLVRDYTTALDALPELRHEREQECRRRAELRQYGQALIDYARAARKSPPGTVKLPQSPDTRRVHPNMVRVEAASRSDTVEPVPHAILPFATFVSTHSHELSAFADLAIVLARNHAADGPVVQQAERLVDAASSAWLSRDPRPPASPLRPACLRTLAGHSGGVEAVAITPDGQSAVSAGRDGTVRVWDIASGELRTLNGHAVGEVNAVALTPDGQTAVSGGHDLTVRVWELASGKLLRTLAGHTQWVTAVVLTPDGQTVVSVGEDRTMRVWELASGKLLRTIEGEDNDWFTAIALTADCQTIVSAGRYGTVRVWELATGKMLRTMEGHTEVNCLALAPDGQTVLSGGKYTVRVWELDSGKLLRKLEAHTDWVRDVAVTPDGRTAVSASGDGSVRVWELASGKLLRNLEGHTSGVNAVAVTPDGQTAVSASSDRSVRVWDLASGTLPRTVEGHTDGVWALGLTRDAQTVVSTGGDHTVRVWELASGKLLRTLAGHNARVTAVVLTPDGQTAISAGHDDAVCVWNLATGKLLRTMIGHTPSVTVVALTPDGQTAVSAAYEGTLRVWRLDSGNLLRTLTGHGMVAAMALTADGQAAISAGYDHTVRVWKLASGEVLQTLPGHTGGATALALTSDDQTVVAADWDGTLRMWDLASGNLLKTLAGHTGRVAAVAVTPDGQTAVSVGEDRTMRVWELTTGMLIALYPLESDGTAVVATGNNRFVAGTESGQLHFISLRRPH